MKVVFDLSLDGPGYPGPLGDAPVAYGEAWVGPLGFLGLLETSLGLGGAFCDSTERTNKLVLSLKTGDGFWKKSFNVDPSATSDRLLRDRDLLALWGWRGQPASPRLAQLAEATASAQAGLPDRLRAAIEALSQKRPALDSVTSFAAAEHLPPLWLTVFQALESQGVAVTWKQLDSVAAKGDLAAVRNTPFVPQGDGSLVLLRRHGPLDTADEVAATLAAMPDLEGVVVIGADAVLDDALARHGLPVSGHASGAPASSRLLNLIVETAFCPMDLGFMHALLTLEISPIPRAIGAQLVRALQKCPGRGSSEFQEALQEALNKTSDEQREELTDRVKQFLLPAANQTEDSLTVQAIETRVTALEQWARARAVFEPSLRALLAAIPRFRAAVTALGEATVSRQALRRICGDVGADSWNFSECQAGLVHVRTPGAILAPAKTVVWWNFSRASAPRATRLFLTEIERAALAASGVKAPDARLMLAHAAAWQRPLQQTQSQLLLACPLHDESGERAELHPLWDELIATMPKADTVAKLVVTKLNVPVAAKTKMVVARPLVQPALHLKTHAPLKPRDIESPSSIEKLLGCSLSWTLHYLGHLDAGLASPVPQPSPLLYGSLAHQLLEQVLLRPEQTEIQAAEYAAELFDQQPKDAFEALHLPQYQAEKATLRLAVVESARTLVRLVRKHKAVIMGTEVVGQISAGGQIIKGHSDFVWKEPAVILDLKWGKTSPTQKLKSGTHLQLAAYAAMHTTKGQIPEAGYFSLMSQDVLAEPGGILQQDGIVPGNQTVEAVWKATLAAFETRRSELGRGELQAPGATGEDLESGLSGSTLSMAPECRYCGYSQLCGREAAR